MPTDKKDQPVQPGSAAAGTMLAGHLPPRLIPASDDADETHDIESITFEIVFKSGRMQRAEFIRTEKTLSLLGDRGSLGDFLRGLVKRGTD